MARKPKQDADQNTMSDHAENTMPAATNQAEPAIAGQVNDVTESGAAKFAEAEYRSRCGGALRLAREKQGLSTRDVANHLRLSVKQIEAIESDHFAALPEPTIVKGFIRNYAKFLKIPVEPLLDAYLVVVPNKTQHSLTLEPASGMRLNDTSKSPGLSRYFLILLSVLLAVGLWFFYQGYIQKPSPVLPSTELKEPLPEIALPMAERNNAPEALALPPADPSATPDATAATDTAAATASESLNLPAEPGLELKPPVGELAPENTLAENKPTETAPAGSQPADLKNYRIEINASQETWVSVVDASQKEMYNKILFPGNREVIEAKPPLNIVVGNAHGATLTVNNQAVDLAPHTRVNVARLRVD